MRAHACREPVCCGLMVVRIWPDASSVLRAPRFCLSSDDFNTVRDGPSALEFAQQAFAAKHPGPHTTLTACNPDHTPREDIQFVTRVRPHCAGAAKDCAGETTESLLELTLCKPSLPVCAVCCFLILLL